MRVSFKRFLTESGRFAEILQYGCGKHERELLPIGSVRKTGAFRTVGKKSALNQHSRRPDTVPLVYQSRSWNNGVFIGSITGSETTAAAAGAVGVVRRDPMAMLPFCGYNMGDYWQHWLEMGKKLGDKAPKIFNVNWFRTDDEGHFIWPGFGDNLRVLEWILKRCDNEVDAVETAIGYVPKPEDINLEGLKDFDKEKLASILKVDNAKWAKEAAGVEEFYKKFGDKLPQELRDELNGLEERTKA